MVPFYNDNANRAYPFVDVGPLEMLYSGGGFVTLPDSLVVDFTCIIGPVGAFEEDTHRVYLYEVSRTGSTIQLTFRFTAPALAGYSLTFCRLLTDTEFTTAYGTASPTGSIEVTSYCNDVLLEGWLTTGTFAALAAVLADGEFLRRGDASIYVEPARIQSLYAGFVQSVNLANTRRTLATPPDVCSSDEPGSADPALLTRVECITGALRFKAGYNCSVRQNLQDNSIIIGAGVGLGEGEPCSEVPLYDGELPPDGSTLLTGGPACNEVIKTINGVPGPLVNFLSGVGVTIQPSYTNPHELVVDVDLHGLVICADFPEGFSSSEPPSEEPPPSEDSQSSAVPPSEEPPSEEPPSEEPSSEAPPSEEPPSEEPSSEAPPSEEPPSEEPSLSQNWWSYDSSSIPLDSSFGPPLLSSIDESFDFCCEPDPDPGCFNVTGEVYSRCYDREIAFPIPTQPPGYICFNPDHHRYLGLFWLPTDLVDGCPGAISPVEIEVICINTPESGSDSPVEYHVYLHWQGKTVTAKGTILCCGCYDHYVPDACEFGLEFWVKLWPDVGCDCVEYPSVIHLIIMEPCPLSSLSLSMSLPSGPSLPSESLSDEPSASAVPSSEESPSEGLSSAIPPSEEPPFENSLSMDSEEFSPGDPLHSETIGMGSSISDSLAEPESEPGEEEPPPP